MKLSCILFALVTLVCSRLQTAQAQGAWSPPPKEAWRSRTIYQVLIDRFDKGTEQQHRCWSLNEYCGGVWSGLKKELPYIQKLGFDAIWISPINEQTGGPDWEYPDGYHGYWPKNLWGLNERFGTEAELQDLIDTMHSMGMWVMLDTVPNHSGFGATSEIAVFNRSDMYHTCDGCLLGCKYSETSDWQAQHCRLSNLPDLDQDNAYVSQMLMAWHNTTYLQHRIDGYRIDAAKHVQPTWLDDLRRNVSIFTIGEFTMQFEPLAQRLAEGALDSSLHFPLQGPLKAAFMGVAPDMGGLKAAVQQNRDTFGAINKTHDMGVFLENHDQSRFMCMHNDVRAYENAHTFVLFAEGIPIVYYGAELGMLGQRDPLWQIRDNPNIDIESGELFKFMQILIGVRKRYAVWNYPMVDLNLTGPGAGSYYAFQRGPVVVVVNNLGRDQRPPKGAALTLTFVNGTLPGQTLVNVLFPELRKGVRDQLAFDALGSATFQPRPDRWPQVYVLATDPAVSAGGGGSGGGMGEFVEHETARRWLGPDGQALIAFWVLSGVLAALLWLCMSGMLHQLSPIVRMRKRLGAHPASDSVELGSVVDDKVLIDKKSDKGSDSGSHTPMQLSSGRGSTAASHSVEMRGMGGVGTSGVTTSQITVVVDNGTSANGHNRETASNHSNPASGSSSSSSSEQPPAAAHAVGSTTAVTATLVAAPPTTAQPNNSNDAGATAATALVTPGGGVAISTPASKQGGDQQPAGERRTSPMSTLRPAPLAVPPALSMARSVEVPAGLLPHADDVATNPPPKAALYANMPMSAQPRLSRNSIADPPLPFSHSPRIATLTRRQIVAPPWLRESRVLQSGVLQSVRMSLDEGTGTLPRSVSHAWHDNWEREPPVSPSPRGRTPHGRTPRATHAQHPLSSVYEDMMESAASKKAGADSSLMQGAISSGGVGGGGGSDLRNRRTRFAIPGAHSMTPHTPRHTVLEVMASPYAAADAEAAAAAAAAAPSSLPGAPSMREAVLVRPGACSLAAPPSLILHVAMEYSIPHLGYDSQFMYGGLGKVVDLFLKSWPGPIGLCCPLYKDAYEDDMKDDAPKFLAGTEPTLVFSAVVARRHVTVELFMLQHDNVTYFFLQADIFRHRVRANIYAFQEEAEMLTWVSVMSQAVSVVISTFDIQRVQFHDWHGTMALMYLPQEVRPEVLLVAHNAHYNGTFPIPNKRRRLYLYSMFDLDIAAAPQFMEHKGCLDMLCGVLTWIKEYQDGIGVVAVSPRYAEQICAKLDVFWQLRARDVVGVMNALPLTNCLAAEVDEGRMTFEDVLREKSRAKAEFQARFGLATTLPASHHHHHHHQQLGAAGDHLSQKLNEMDKHGHQADEPWHGPQLVVFLGRMTHQKGCDTIARAAGDFLAQCPQCQLVMVGPVGDVTGAEAQQLLVKVAEKYPGRVYAPPGKYFSGDEKALLLKAADFCLVPSRFEPCGLVDIEFGWEGAVMIGHNTGGLGKMPGVYYEVESSARGHLAARLADAVVRAMALTPVQRRQLMQDALARRFSTEEMMARYDAEWEKVSAACLRAVEEEEEAGDAELAQDNQEFFSQLWKKHNLMDAANSAAGRKLDRGASLRLVAAVTGTHVGRQSISAYLLLFMQAFCKLPALMVSSFFVATYLGFTTISSCQDSWDLSYKLWPELMNNLGFRVMLTYAIYIVAAPAWTLIAMYMQPRRYVQLMVVLVLLAAVISHACMYWTVTINFAIMVTNAIAPMGVPLISLNFLGQNKEVAEVGLKYMTITEVATAVFMFGCSLLAAMSMSNLPFVAVNGLTVFVAALYVAWFWSPAVLHPAYRHYRLVFKNQWMMIVRISTFWLTTLVMVCENVALVLTAYATLLQWRLAALMQLIAVNYAAQLLSLLSNYGFMKLRCSQLRVQTLTLGIAALPGFAVAKQLAVVYAPGLWGVLLTAALVEFVYGCRFQLVGLLAFQTLPSRELVAIWQLLVLLASTIIPFVVLITGFTTQVNYSNTTNLLIGVGVCEGVRMVAMLLLKMVHHKENLSTL